MAYPSAPSSPNRHPSVQKNFHPRSGPAFWLLTVITGVLLRGATLMNDLPKVAELDPLIHRLSGQTLPPVLAAAVVEHEDRRFYRHGGLDVAGLARATWSSLTGRTLQGGSTLTQQLVKNTLLADQHGARTLTRKVQEAWLAVQVDRRYSKTDILKAYLTVAYWGAVGDRQVVGGPQAARAYFGVTAARLDLAQSAYLATLLPPPARAGRPAEVRPLIKVLLDQMVVDGRATPAQAAAAWTEAGHLRVLR